jgi:hypothetical protein
MTPDAPAATDVVTLATAQLAAYNAGDLSTFVACYHPDVVVWEDGEKTVEGRDKFRARYEDLFSGSGFGASVPGRLTEGRHCVDLEVWWRVHPDTLERTEGRILVRYTERDGLIATVQFLD